MKYCPKCKLSKPKTAFWANSTKHDGLGSYCISCSKKYSKKYTEYARLYKKRRYKEDKKFRERVLEQNYKYKNRTKNRATEIVYETIKKGKLKKDGCFICGNKNVHGHHKDYTKPLDVIWLCPKHHKWLHVGEVSL